MGNQSVVNLSPAFCIMLAMMLLILPLKWLLAAVTAAAFHELCHVAAVYLCHGHIQKLNLSAGGAKLDVSTLSYSQELLCSLAGPLGGLCLLLFAQWIPRIAVCAAFQSLYNLLPIYPLDGGRALWCSTTLLLTEKYAKKFCKITEKVCLCLIIIAALYAAVILELGISALFPAILILVHTNFRKTPCKQRLQRVQ